VWEAAFFLSLSFKAASAKGAGIHFVGWFQVFGWTELFRILSPFFGVPQKPKRVSGSFSSIRSKNVRPKSRSPAPAVLGIIVYWLSARLSQGDLRLVPEKKTWAGIIKGTEAGKEMELLGLGPQRKSCRHCIQTPRRSIPIRDQFAPFF